jgi:hypothetical protein
MHKKKKITRSGNAVPVFNYAAHQETVGRRRGYIFLSSLTSALDGSGQPHAPAAYPKKRALGTMDRRLGGSHSRLGRCEEKNLLPLPEIEPRFLSRTTHSLVAILTELSRLQNNFKNVAWNRTFAGKLNGCDRLEDPGTWDDK